MTLKTMRFIQWKRPRFHPVAWGVIIGTFLSRAGFFMTIPFLGIYLGQTKGIDAATVGAILAVSFLVGTFSSFLGGVLSDYIGRYPVMIASMLLWSLVFLGFSAADTTWAFFALSALNGLCRNVFEPTARALLADVTTSERRASVFHARYFAINIGGAIGPLVGLQLGSSSSTLPFLLTACIYFVYGCAILGFMMLFKHNTKAAKEEKVEFKNMVRVILSDKVFRYFLIGNVFVVAGYSHLDTTLSQYMGHGDVSLYSFLFFVNAASVLVFQYPISQLTKNVSALTSLKVGSICFGIGLFGFGLFHSIVPLVLSMVTFTIGEILCFVIGDIVISEIAPEHLRGAYYGASGFQFLGQSFGSWIGGVLLSSLGFQQGPLIFGVLMLLTMLAYPFFQIGQRRLEHRGTDDFSIQKMA